MTGPLLWILLSFVSTAVGIDCRAPEVCATQYCEYGRLLDADGCETCACAPAIRCVCGTQCKLANGPGICGAEGVCVSADTAVSCPRQCNTLNCLTFCGNGYVMDADGCPTCACKEASTLAQRCPCGQACTVDGGRTGVCQADGLTCAQNIVAPKCTTCSNLLCRMFCPFGNEVDANGCPLCACKPDPSPVVCPCGTACRLADGRGDGVCAKDDRTCADVPLDVGLKLCSVEHECPLMMCMRYCPMGNLIDTNGCTTCVCNEEPSQPCPCGGSCKLSASEVGVCQKDGTCGTSLALERTPCAPVCDGMMCKMYCPYGNVVSNDGCPSCKCNPAPVEPCVCGEACTSGSDVGVCQADGTCDAGLTKPLCKAKCPEVLCMMYCEHGTLRDETTGCPSCKCNPPPLPCVCGYPCVSGGRNGTCQADGLTCAVSDLTPRCDGFQCPLVKCSLYCPNGNAKDENGCISCRCNPPALSACRCGEQCTQANGETGVCQRDGATCLAATKEGVRCEKQCPALACNLFCPSGNALDENGCATCGCLPDRVPCKCGQTCWANGKAGVCAADGSCGPMTATPSCQQDICPAVRCMMFCPGGNEVEANGCPSCRCKVPKPCPCGAKCEVSPTTNGVCSADGVCTVTDVAPSCPSCPAKLCMMFCPKGNVIDANGCSTCRCLDDVCPCGAECKISGGAGVCNAEGRCVSKLSGTVISRAECAAGVHECPVMKCMKYCPQGNTIDDKGCPTCECKADSEPVPCPCGTPCTAGVCLEDGRTCAKPLKAPVCPKTECPKMMCMVFCPNGQAVDAMGCPSCKCNPVPKSCPCGETCTMSTGGSGVCQTDGVTCAVNIMAPQCVKSLAATTCMPLSCENFCEFGTTVDSNNCPTCECRTRCPCGSSCALGGGLIGTCQSDGITCVAKSVAVDCSRAAANSNDNAVSGGVSGGLIVGIVAIVILFGLTVGVLMCRRTQRKVGPEQNYADEMAMSSGYVAPVTA